MGRDDAIALRGRWARRPRWPPPAAGASEPLVRGRHRGLASRTRTPTADSRIPTPTSWRAIPRSGASAAVADFDGDGFDDLFVTDSAVDGKNHLYRNNGNLTFTDVAAEAGVANGNDAANASADSLWFDYDNDGRPDLLVVRFGQTSCSKTRQRTFTTCHGGRGSTTLLQRHHRHRVRLRPRRRRSICSSASYFQPVNIFNPDDAALLSRELRDREQRRRPDAVSQQRRRHVHRRDGEGWGCA